MLHTQRSGKANYRLKWYATECYSKKKEIRRFLNKYNRSSEEADIKDCVYKLSANLQTASKEKKIWLFLIDNDRN